MANMTQPHPRLIRLAREVGALPAEPRPAQPIEKPPALNAVLAKLRSLFTAGRRFAR
jgi:hypothetical protein